MKLPRPLIQVVLSLFVVALCSAAAPAPAPAPAVAPAGPRVALETTKGRIVIELFPSKAPKTVANFLMYVKSGHYNGTIFHRVIPDFMAQGGGFTPDMVEKPTKAPVQNEADNGLHNDRGTVAMARTSDPHSATSQFFINVKANTGLNFTSKTSSQGWGYTVFGKVVEGMGVVDAIVAVPTTNDVPQQPIVIKKARLLSSGK